MKRCALAVVAVAFLLAGPAGCGRKETDELAQKVARQQQQLAEKEKELDDLRAKAAETQSQLEAATEELVHVKVERDKLKKEIAALKKRQLR